MAAGDPRLVLDIRMGRQVKPEMESKLRDFISTYNQQNDVHEGGRA